MTDGDEHDERMTSEADETESLLQHILTVLNDFNKQVLCRQKFESQDFGEMTEQLRLSEAMDQLRVISTKPDFRKALDSHSDLALQILLQTFRNWRPSLHARIFPEPFYQSMRQLLGKGIESDFIRILLLKESFAKCCLGYVVASSDDAISLIMILYRIVSTFSKLGPQVRSYWMVANEAGALLLINQVCRCVGFLLPEICLPVVMKVKLEQLDLYTYLLIGLCSLVPQLSCSEMHACSRSLAGQLLSQSPLVVLFVSDVMKFMASLCPQGTVLGLMMDATSALSSAYHNGSGQITVLKSLCSRILRELSSTDKGTLSQRLPIYRHFIVWSQMPLDSVYERQSSLVLELYDEATKLIDEFLSQKSSSNPKKLRRSLVQLPSALACLVNVLAVITFKEKRSNRDLKAKIAKASSLFSGLWKLLTGVPAKKELVVLRLTMFHTIRLGTLVHSLLREQEISQVLEFLVSPESEDTLLCLSSADFLAAVGASGKLGKKSALVIKRLLSVAFLYNQFVVRNKALLTLLDIGSRSRCESLFVLGSPGEAVSAVETWSLLREMDERQLITWLQSVSAEQAEVPGG